MTMYANAQRAKDSGQKIFVWQPCRQCGGTVRYTSNLRCVACIYRTRYPNPTPATIFLRQIILGFGMDEMAIVTGYDLSEIYEFIAGKNINEFVINCFVDAVHKKAKNIIKEDS